MIPQFEPGESRGTLTIEYSVRHGIGCSGEGVVLRFISGDIGQVVSSRRCGGCPPRGCNGIPYFQPGDLVGLPIGWRLRPEASVRTEELWPLPGFNRGVLRRLTPARSSTAPRSGSRA
jgi:hypothetical protein